MEQSERQEQGVWARFFAGFLQEKNIRWMLAVGSLLLTGSSLLLVANHWEESTSLWKHFVLLGYVGCLDVGARVLGGRVGLLRTGQALSILETLLIPITFLAFDWFRPDAAIGAGGPWVAVAVLGAQTAIAAHWSRRIFRRLFQGDEITYLAAYLLLSLAGAVAPRLSAAAMPWAALTAWAVVLLGAIKASRRAFWLVDDKRVGESPLAHAVGFLPVALLGAQFLALFGFHFARAIPVPWMGLGLALAAVPLLVTADAGLRVVEQRTGSLLRPLPFALLAPVAAALVLCAGGIALAGSPLFLGGKPLALVPAAAITAALTFAIASRLRKPGLAWAAIAATVIAYQFSPVFFLDLASRVIASAAHAVREPRLPFSFYGLTYLPLIATTALAARLLAGKHDALARPLRLVALAATGLLTLAAFGHPKALFPVAAALTLAAVGQMVLFRDRRIVVLGVVAICAAAGGFAGFAGGVLAWLLPPGAQFLALGTLAAALFVAGPRLDGQLGRLPWGTDESLRGDSSSIAASASNRADDDLESATARLTGLGLSASVTIGWLAIFGLSLEGSRAWAAGALAAALALAQAIRFENLLLGKVALGAATAIALSIGLTSDVPSWIVWTGLSLAFCALAGLSRVATSERVHLGLRALFDAGDGLALRVHAAATLAMLASILVWGEATAIEACAVTIASMGLLVALLYEACRQKSELYPYLAQAVTAILVVALVRAEVIVLGRGVSLFACVGGGWALWMLGRWAQKNPATVALVRPSLRTSTLLPLGAVALAVMRHLLGAPAQVVGLRSLALFLAAAFYAWRGIQEKRRGLLFLGAGVLNVGLAMLWLELRWSDLQLYLMPIGISIIAVAEILKHELPRRERDALRYAGALAILVSPVASIVSGSWLHMLSLMIAATLAVLAAIGLRSRPFLQMGIAFLCADLAAMVVRAVVDRPGSLWLVGLGLGTAVITLAALCENRREAIQSRLRRFSAAMAAWE